MPRRKPAYGAPKIAPPVCIYPVPGVTFYPWPPIPQDVSASDWAELQEVRPPPFTDRPPPGQEPERPTEPTEQVGSSDSEGED